MLFNASVYEIKELLLYSWPKIMFPETRSKFKDTLRRVSVQQRKSEMSSGSLSRKIDPWAFIRVKNERTTLLASLNSILPVIHKGVIAYNDCTDGSDKIIEQFCRDNSGFFPFRYPYYVEPACSAKYKTGELKEKNTLAGYYNAVLQMIPQNEWLIKIDVDQIYFPKILEHSFYLPKSTNDVVSYSRLNVIRDSDNNLRIIEYIRPGDHWLVFNNNLRFINIQGYDKFGKYFACEQIKWSKRGLAFKPECSSIHFPFEKDYKKFCGSLGLLPLFEDYLSSADKSEFSEDLINIFQTIMEFETPNLKGKVK